MAATSLRMDAFFKMPNTRLYIDNRFKFLGASVALLLGFLAFAPNNDISEANATSKIVTPEFDLTRLDLYDDPAFNTELSELTLTIKSGDNLGPLLQKNGIDPGEAYQITQAFSEVYDPRHLRVGHKFNLLLDNDKLAHLTFKPSVDETIFLSRKDNGAFSSNKVAAEFKMDVLSVKSSVEYSLYLDSYKYGVPDRVIQQFANIYEYSVDFQRDIQPGDEFEMFFEATRDKKGNIVKSGNLLYTSFSPRGKTTEYYLFEDTKGRENFYDETGKTAKRKLRVTPINGARLSSGFGKRRHPILGYRKMHSGIDFAAPTGTPILAAGSGTVERANRYGGYGNYIRIRHSDGYKTAYAHLSKFARGVKAGKYVKQDQVIGYVGSTGASTGPHLHYEVHKNGRKINPRSLSQLSGKPLAKSQMPAFETRRTEIDKMRATAEILKIKPKDPELVAENRE